MHSIRVVREEDSPEMARLAGQLGYPTDAGSMGLRLRRLLDSPNDIVFVAESADGALIGWAHGFLSQLLESDFRAEIGGLIVDERFHRQGIGRELVRRIEVWAAEHGAAQVSVRCRTTRPEAHQFYEKLGYQPAKTQIAFRKTLGGVIESG